MKGFARILETMIAAIIILTSLSFFLPITIKQSGWDSTLLELRAQDAIIAGYNSGNIAQHVRNNDNTSLRNFLEKLFTKSTDFSVQITGIPNPVIFVGCSCSDGQLEDIKSRLAPLTFRYRGRNMEIRPERIAVSDIPNETDVLLFMSAADINNEYVNRKNTIDKFIENGGTLFLIGDLKQPDANPSNPDLDYMMRNIFNISWSSESESPGNSGKFREATNPERISYNIAKYYQNLTGVQNPGNENFQQFNGDSSTNKISVGEKSIVATSNDKFSFAKGNMNVINGNGRAVWLAENDKSEDMKNLTKAIVMWASGENYKMDGAAKKTPPQVSQSAGMIIHDGDTYEFRLTAWNVF